MMTTRMLVAIAASLALFALSVPAVAETFRLIHAIGNSEKEAARGLSKAECEKQKTELKKTAAALGTYNEKTGYGSITCLPESVFN